MQSEAVWNVLRKGRKYVGLFRIHLKNHFAYVHDFLIRTLFLLVVLFIFTQLWGVTYEVTGRDRIAGFSLPMMMWYLTVTESMMMAYPPLVERVEQEVKSGQVAVTLIRPFSYVGAHFSAYLAEFILRLSINLVIGGALVFLLFGPPEVGPGQAGRFLLFLPVSLVIHFSFTMCIALLAFWFEEVQGFHLIYTRLLMTLGGMMLPLEIFPESVERLAHVLPFQAVIYLPAKMMVTEPGGLWWSLWLKQIGWALFSLALMGAIYRRGVRNLDLNGG